MAEEKEQTVNNEQRIVTINQIPIEWKGKQLDENTSLESHVDGLRKTLKWKGFGIGGFMEKHIWKGHHVDSWMKTQM